MNAVRGLLRNNIQIKNVAQARNMSAIATPPRNKVSGLELIVLASAMVVGWCAIPAYVLVNMKNYRDKA